ncbi:protein of unknown function [Nitrospina watsonii]|uniref:Uncharacterized protein n=1 Tax=Nitrospina watsonii TaxID=1323948 RepID=A0ABN8W0T7_9BACT|nr:protein of unknown function [Nitrospina watsonii]
MGEGQDEGGVVEFPFFTLTPARHSVSAPVKGEGDIANEANKPGYKTAQAPCPPHSI